VANIYIVCKLNLGFRFRFSRSSHFQKTSRPFDDRTRSLGLFLSTVCLFNYNVVVIMIIGGREIVMDDGFTVSWIRQLKPLSVGFEKRKLDSKSRSLQAFNNKIYMS